MLERIAMVVVSCIVGAVWLVWQIIKVIIVAFVFIYESITGKL